jgi:diadenosine tetraphosphate (Ap4A) HIT family hydrolase
MGRSLHDGQTRYTKGTRPAGDLEVAPGPVGAYRVAVTDGSGEGNADGRGAAASKAACVFCSIVAGRAEVSLVHADDAVLAFMDIAPVNPGHILVIPRAHAPHLADLDEDDGARMWRVAHRVAGALRQSGLRAEGVNFFLADGAAAFQEVFHIHLHVFPRYRGDGFRVETAMRKRQRAELDADAALVGRALTQLPLP